MCMHAKSLQSHPTLCDPMDFSSVHGISQAGILEWVAIHPPGDLPDPGTEPMSLKSPALTSRFFTTSATWEALRYSPWSCKESDVTERLNSNKLEKTPQNSMLPCLHCKGEMRAMKIVSNKGICTSLCKSSDWVTPDHACT